MWKQIHKKLRSRAGETLAEVLVALLIIALSSMLLVVMYNVATSIDLATRARDKIFYEDLSRAETHSSAPGGAEAGSSKIQITDVTGVADLTEGKLLKEFDVTTYGGNGLTSYEKKPGLRLHMQRLEVVS